MKGMLLSVFPGADLLGRAFEHLGWCVVRGPDLVWGGDIRNFHCPPGVFTLVIGGSPCQDFSDLRRDEPTGYGVEMLGQFVRVVVEAQPEGFLLENTRRVPSIEVPGYEVQRFNLCNSECGGKTTRLRTFQWGHRHGVKLVIDRGTAIPGLSPLATASEGRRKGRRTFADFCELQGLPRDFDLPGLSLEAKYRAVGNGVPLQMGGVIARAVSAAGRSRRNVRLCVCDCGREVPAGRTMAEASCRKRMQRRRDGARVTDPGPVTSGLSLQTKGFDL
jgi:DNA (cytosine-5)-methyltransferase 1